MSTERDPADEPAEASEPADTTSGEDAGDHADASPREYLRGWFTGRMPADWFTAAPAIDADR
jgi:hypothetical protein